MKLGVFAKTYERSAVDQVFQSAARDGFSCVQFNLASSGLDTLPHKSVPEAITRDIQLAARRHRIEIVAVSGTFNMAHPLASVRREGGKRLKNVLAWAAANQVPAVTLCTGSRDPVDMWRAHPENHSQEAWEDLMETLKEALSAAEAAGRELSHGARTG
jgi:sugar phosphate isomerase/epimerase